jgi:phosphate transport system protein
VTFHEEMRVMEDHVLTMADLVGASVEASVTALAARDDEAAHAVVAGDERVNELHAEITLEGLHLIATQQPMASDLREILAITSIATDLERMGDYAKGIGTVTLRLQGPLPEAAQVHVAQMQELVRGLLAAAVDALVAKDAEAARAAAGRDDDIDGMYDLIYRELMDAIRRRPEGLQDGDLLLWAAKSLERCGDHATNICEWIVFQATGQLVELND